VETFEETRPPESEADVIAGIRKMLLRIEMKNT
jgi:Holliday junction resolvase